jgi:hypothetical protein
MIAKILAFVLLSLGAMVGVGMLGSWFTGFKSTAMTIGEHAITYGNLLLVAAVVVVVWITSKV